LGPVQKLWKFDIGHPSPTDKAAIKQKLSKVGYDKIHLENEMDADALSSALFVMGTKKGLAFIDSLKNTEGLIVDQNKSSQLSKGMKDLANFSLESFKENISH
jgi:thiamine biosynthesis lipoprotein ApbE